VRADVAWHLYFAGRSPEAKSCDQVRGIYEALRA
jgi:hypothetical protein